ncbi:MAG: ATP-binding cassette domain-containing protein [Alphaproteobacteria bacterium]|nr:ATP-binding cassette domain-containing protein [Alphaproteobacteria bacterium]
MTDHPALHLDGVSKRYGAFLAVDRVDLRVARGTVHGLLGPNGSGKSTCMRMALGLLPPDGGTVSLLGGPPDDDRRRRVGYLPEQRGLYLDMGVLDHLQFFGQLRGLQGKAARDAASYWLERLGLTDWAKKKARALSKGMQQKVQLAGAVLHEPELLVLDEPFTGLDPVAQDLLEDIIDALRAKGTTIVLSTHQLDHAERQCERVTVISRSKVVLEDTVDGVRRRGRTGWYAVQADGDDAWMVGDDVVDRRREGPVTHLRLSGDDPRPLMARAVAAGVRLDRLEAVLPSLRDVVVGLVGERGVAGEAAEAGEAAAR